MHNIKIKTEEYMNLIVTHKCPNNCQFCIDKYKGNDEYISISNVKNAINFASKNNITDVLITGGEPTLHPEILTIVKLLKLAKLKTILTTNYCYPYAFHQLDGWVDNFNISYYGQEHLPKQSELMSNLTLHSLIYNGQLDTHDKLDSFIEVYKDYGHLKFSTLSICNEWTKQHQKVSYLDTINCKWIVLFNEILGQLYKGCLIKRYDKVINSVANQSYKVHPDGTINQSWDR